MLTPSGTYRSRSEIQEVKPILVNLFHCIYRKLQIVNWKENIVKPRGITNNRKISIKWLTRTRDCDVTVILKCKMVEMFNYS